MKRILKITFLSLGIFGLVVIGGFLYIFKDAFTDGCASTYLDSSISPSGKKIIKVFNYDCGATTGFTTNLTLMPNSGGNLKELPKNNDEIFFKADTDHGRVEVDNTYPYGGPKININWISENKIKIRYPKNSRIYRADINAKNVEIEYDVKSEDLKNECIEIIKINSVEDLCLEYK